MSTDESEPTADVEPWPTIDELLPPNSDDSDPADETDPDDETETDDGDRQEPTLEDLVDRLATIEADPDVDPRDHVFTASTLVAQVAIGRAKSDDESWDDVVQIVEEDDRSSLASALWVGLSDQPVARHPSLDHWRRSITTAIRSDTATAAMVAQQSAPRSIGRSVVVGFAAAGLLMILGVAGFLLAGGNDAVTEAADSAATETGGDPDSDTGSDPDSDTGGETEPGGPTTDDGSADADAGADGAGDEPSEGPAGGPADGQVGEGCEAVGPLGPLFIDQVTDRAIVIGWSPTDEPVDILLDGSFVDTMPPDADQYVIEHRPLLPPPLPADTEFLVEVTTDGEQTSGVCATTADEPLPGDESPVGVYAPTGLQVGDLTSTSITVTWDARPGADEHNLYLDGRYVDYGGGQGSTAIGNETEFTLFDLEPGTTYDIGIRRVEGFNQSGQATLRATTLAD